MNKAYLLTGGNEGDRYPSYAAGTGKYRTYLRSGFYKFHPSMKQLPGEKRTRRIF